MTVFEFYVHFFNGLDEKVHKDSRVNLKFFLPISVITGDEKEGNFEIIISKKAGSVTIKY